MQLPIVHRWATTAAPGSSGGNSGEAAAAAFDGASTGRQLHITANPNDGVGVSASLPLQPE
jgi:hypothetical protein